MAFKSEPQIEEITSRDGKLVFDPITHSYMYNGEHLRSVTQFIKTLHKPFDPLFASINKSKKNSEHKTGITNAKLLRKYWRLKGEYSSSIGTATHVFAEMYQLDNTLQPRTGYEKAVIKAFKKLDEKWEIISQEEIVYSLEYMIAGSIDLILRNKKTKEYAIADWKTTEDMHRSFGKLYKPFNIDNSPLNKYSIQLDIYSLLAPYRIPETNRIIIQLKSDGNVEYYTPKSRKKENKLPYTIDKTKKALITYKKENVK